MVMTKKYWLRGGVTGVILALCAVILPYVFQCIDDPICNAAEFINDFGGLADWLGPGLSLLFLLLNVLPGFLLGTLLGWLYGKIKNRNKI